ncbi:hypothetical protein HJG60_009247 [Phyllostomus discolor]|uniref:Uncharacterized protein n=1 Tax=Phyllostomus discolor TaxID=89673 RepID=A0A833YPP7_9CHIR|nr:hypothetical protein HJG60_009247 [Phyllostomus discolor]
MPWFLPLDTLVAPGPVPWCPHNSPYLAEEHQAIPIGVSDRSDGCFLGAADLICLDFFFFFWLWSKVFSCHHFTVFSSNPFFKHCQQLVNLSLPPTSPTPISTHTHTPLSPITVLFCLKYKKLQLLISWRARLERLCVYSLSK